MNYMLPLAGVALALSLTTANAADYNRGDHRNRDAVAQHQQDNGRFEPRRGDNDRGAWHNGERNRWQPHSNNNWRNNNWRAHRFDQFRRNLHSPRRFRVGVYHAPRNHFYRHWSYGERLPFAYLARSYWLSNVLFYGLFAPPPGLIWVRYGPDALLVDQYTGEIVQVRYGVFY